MFAIMKPLTLFEEKFYSRVGFWQVLCMFNLTTLSTLIYLLEMIKFKKL